MSIATRPAQSPFSIHVSKDEWDKAGELLFKDDKSISAANINAALWKLATQKNQPQWLHKFIDFILRTQLDKLELKNIFAAIHQRASQIDHLKTRLNLLIHLDKDHRTGEKDMMLKRDFTDEFLDLERTKAKTLADTILLKTTLNLFKMEIRYYTLKLKSGKLVENQLSNRYLAMEKKLNADEKGKRNLATPQKTSAASDAKSDSLGMWATVFADGTQGAAQADALTVAGLSGEFEPLMSGSPKNSS